MSDDDRYPILVKKWPSASAPLTIVCQRCDAEEVIHADDLLNEGLYACPRWAEGCEGSAIMKYEEADECPGCKTLGFYDSTVNAGRCSRKCMFQAEYAATLAKP